MPTMKEHRARFYSVPDGQPAADGPRPSLKGSEAAFRQAWNAAGNIREVAQQFGISNEVASAWAGWLRRRGYQLKKFPTGRAKGAPPPRPAKLPPNIVEDAHTFDQLNDKLRLGLALTDAEEERMQAHIAERAAECRRLRAEGDPISNGGSR